MSYLEETVNTLQPPIQVKEVGQSIGGNPIFEVLVGCEDGYQSQGRFVAKKDPHEGDEVWNFKGKFYGVGKSFEKVVKPLIEEKPKTDLFRTIIYDQNILPFR